MANVFIIDCETLGIYDNSIILSVGILKELDERWNYKTALENKPEFWQAVKENSLYIEIDKVEQKNAGRTVLKSTIDWWMQQGEEAKKVLSQPRAISMLKVYDKIKAYFIKHNLSKDDIIFSRRLFENKLLQHFFEVTLKRPNLIHYRQWRDPATLIWALSENPDLDFELFEELNIIKHNPIGDCLLDQLKLRELGL